MTVNDNAFGKNREVKQVVRVFNGETVPNMGQVNCEKVDWDFRVLVWGNFQRVKKRIRNKDLDLLLYQQVRGKVT